MRFRCVHEGSSNRFHRGNVGVASINRKDDADAFDFRRD
jgi:hypothetical protein